MRTSDFEYVLPPELIAQHPTAERGASRLLVVRRGGTVGQRDRGAAGQRDRGIAGQGDRGTAGQRDSGIAGQRDSGTAGQRHSGTVERASDRPTEPLADHHFPDLIGLIPPGDLLVVNTTRVRHARMHGTRPSGAPAEVLLIHPNADGSWIAMGKPGTALRPGKRIRVGPDAEIETVQVDEDGTRHIRFVGLAADLAIARYGRLPLPPYIDRAPDAEDESRYQTVYAAREGSVAAPTAGLHFTPALLDALRTRGVHVAGLDLEVGPGTFKPVETEDIAGHPMHPERFDIPAAAAAEIDAARARGGAVWAVGTTVVRALESAAAAGGTVRPGVAETRLMIAPGHRFQVVDHLVTNFHLPRSTLLMLVAAFAGYDLTMRAYLHAVAARYRFYSYGDAMVIV